MPKTAAAKTNVCLCGCGTNVSGTWARGHAARGADPDLLPGPDEVPEGDGTDDPDELDADPDPAPADRTPPPPLGDWVSEPGPTFETPELRADPAPSAVGRGRSNRRGAKPPKVTAATRTDIAAKLGMMLELTGRVWAVRDPMCGGTFVAQVPPIREASVDLILQSPDLVAWFTGVGGGFMLALNLLVACQPVAVAVWAHHVAHSVELPEQEQGPARSYAA